MPSQRNRSNKLIAIVEADDALRDSLKFVLCVETYRVVAFSHPAAFSASSEIGSFDCLLIDPSLSDAEAAAAGYRAATPRAKVIHLGKADRKLGGNAPAICKPIIGDVVARTVEAVLANTPYMDKALLPHCDRA